MATKLVVAVVGPTNFADGLAAEAALADGLAAEAALADGLVAERRVVAERRERQLRRQPRSETRLSTSQRIASLFLAHFCQTPPPDHQVNIQATGSL